MKKILLLVLCTIGFGANAQLVHPGISHKLSDLERMKFMVKAEKEPWLSTFELIQSRGYASKSYVVNGDPNKTHMIRADNGGFINDATASYYQAILWYITGDEGYAKKAIEIFTSWSSIIDADLGIPLDYGRGPWRMCEAAEIIKHTYHADDYADGWTDLQIKKFADMLVYPGWSGTTVPTGDTTFYWSIYQGDPARHGNQGLFAYRSLMAIAIFVDNEIMYDRVVRYLQGLPHRPDDLAYPFGPTIREPSPETSNIYYNEFSSLISTGSIEDYGFNEVITNYIWETGQSQESSRDQAHALGGVSITSSICEMAWNQGDDLYGHADNRVLLGWEFYFRYNLSYTVVEEGNPFIDQPTPWEPTIESGEFIRRLDRSGRWESLAINPFVGNNLEPDDFARGGNHLLNPVYEQNLGHYKDRLLTLPSEDYKWLQRGFDYLTANKGIEDDNHQDHAGFGGLKYRRVSPGDPISGFDSNGLPIYAMNVLPITIEAENYDYFVLDGQGRTYNDLSPTNTGGAYRTDEGVDTEVCTAGGYHINEMQSGEYVTYTVHIPETGMYNIGINYAGITGNGTLSVSFDTADKTGAVALPATGGEQAWTDFILANNVNLTAGVQSIKITVGGIDNSFNLNNINITAAQKFDQSITSHPLPRIRLGDDDLNLSSVANASSGLDLSFSSSDTSVASIVDGSLQINGVGTTIITASQGGTDLYNPAEDVTVEFEVNPEALGLFIEAEYFDVNVGLRTETTTDEGGGLNIGFTDIGDYLEYLVDVPATGVYVVDYRIASRSDGGTFSLFVNDITVDNLDLPVTGGWQTWETVSSSNEVFLEEGINTVKLTVDARGWNINWFEFREASTLSINDITLGNDFQVYPNPTTNALHVNNGTGYNVSIYNILGKQVLTTKLEQANQSLDVKALPAGVYFVKIGDANNSITKKIIIQ